MSKKNGWFWHIYSFVTAVEEELARCHDWDHTSRMDARFRVCLCNMYRLCFCRIVQKKFDRLRTSLFLFDTIGLGVFTLIGLEKVLMLVCIL
jgi:hypothetical protein